jgi:metal-sulfur cluster biosynthetic enzyme
MNVPDVPTEAGVRQALSGVLDPEIGESIIDLGLLQRIEITPQRVHVVLIPTSATCPMSGLLLEDSIKAVKRACPDGMAVSVVLDWDATWDPHNMSPELQSRFGW